MYHLLRFNTVWHICVAFSNPWDSLQKNINVSFCPTKKKVSKTCNPDSPFFSRERNQEKVWCFALIKLFTLCHVQMFEEKRSILGYFLAGGGNTCYLATGISRSGGGTWDAYPSSWSNFSFACSFWGKLVKIRLSPPSLVLVPHLWNLGWATDYGGVLVQKGYYTLQVMLANDREPLGLSAKRSPCIYVAYKYWWGSHAWMLSVKRSPCMVVGCK